MSHRYKPSVLDLAKPDFDVDAYLARLLKEKSLDELVKEEEEMVASVRRLDSDVHQIVYENYNKFLTATNTVRKIQDEFTQLDEEISALGTSMTNISGLIEGLGDVLGAKREDILQLGSSYKVVKSLKHIFDLPFVLTASFDEKNFGEVIRMYQLASESLRSFADVDSVKRVMEKSHKVYKATEEALMEQLKNPDSSVEAITNSVDLLLAIGRDRDEVHKVLLECSEQSLRTDLRDLGDNHADVLDLVDKGCGSFIPNLTLIAATHERLFPDKVDESLAMVKKLFERELDSFHALVSRSFLSSNDAKDCSIVVRALDRYFRKISTCRHVVRGFAGLDFSKPTIALINEVSVHEIDLSLLRIQEELKNVLQETRQSLVNDGKDLVGLAAKIEHAFVYQVKTALANLLLFTASDVTFSSLPPEDFQVAFAQNAHERLLVQAFHRLFQTADDCADGKGDLRFVGPRLLLVFAVALQHLSNKSAMYLLNLCREQFNLSSSSEQLTSATKVTADVKTRAQRLVRCYAQRNGQQIGEHLAKGCGGGFVQPSASPTTVRAAIRRAVEETLGCDDELVSLLGGESKAKDVKPSRRPGAPGIEAARDSLWCERIDFHQQIHFNRASIMTGIVKVVLKIFTEAIRLQTYSKFGIEQIQVDCYYLQRGLAPLVTDEVMVNSMVDQSLSSALKRCVDPVLVHPSRLAQVCDQLQPAQQQQHRTSSTTSSALGY